MKYIKTFHNGIEVVAVFEYLGEMYPLNEASILSRIRVMEAKGGRAKVERKGLKFLRAHDKYVPPKK